MLPVVASTDLSIFFGRFHPLFIHLPIALVVLLVMIEVVSKLKWFTHLASSVRFIAGISAIAAVLSATAGWLLAGCGEYDSTLVNQHRWTGVAMAGMCVMVFVLHSFRYRKSYHLALFASLILLTITSHLGGSLTHGEGYLAEYAPQSLKKWLGGKDQVTASNIKSPVTTAPTIEPAVASTSPVVFHDVIQPIFNTNCVSCHKQEKAKGKLRLDTYEMTLKGGDAGPNLIAGSSDKSDLYTRLLLPLDDDNHMPPKGKPQPSQAQIDVLRWWIDSGATSDKTIAQLAPPANIAQALEKLVGVTRIAMISSNTSSNSPTNAHTITELKDVTSEAMDLSKKLGIVIVNLSQQGQLLQVNASLSSLFDDNALASLSVIAGNIHTLNLGGTKITDAGLKILQTMPQLRELRLDRTRITDAGLDTLSNVSELTYLNLYGTSVTDAGLKSLTPLHHLHSLYLWQTKITPEAAKAFEKGLTDQTRIDEINAQITDLQKQLHNAYPTVSLGESLKLPTTAPTTTMSAPAVVAKPINTTCPVLGSLITEGKFVVYQGKTIGFCCDICKAKFEKNPTAYLAKLGLAEK